MNQRWQEMRQKVRAMGRPLACPLCQHRFAWRHLRRTAGTCPQCKTAIGIPFYYRAILFVASICAMGWVMYKGYQTQGAGWLLLGLPFAFAAGMLVQGALLRAFPPKLEAHAEGNTWLKLS